MLVAVDSVPGVADRRPVRLRHRRPASYGCVHFLVVGVVDGGSGIGRQVGVGVDEERRQVGRVDRCDARQVVARVELVADQRPSSAGIDEARGEGGLEAVGARGQDVRLLVVHEDDRHRSDSAVPVGGQELGGVGAPPEVRLRTLAP